MMEIVLRKPPLPLRLKAAVLAAVLCVPLAAVETAVAARAPIWRLPHDKMVAWSGAAAVCFLPLLALSVQGRRWALGIAQILASVWCLVSFWMSARMFHPALGFLTLGITVFWVAIFSWISVELSRSFFDPRRKWFEGVPRAISGLECEVVEGEARQVARVTRLDRDGAFLVFRRPTDVNPTKAVVDVRFRFREREATCTARPARMVDLADSIGIGLRFSGVSPDARKRLGDLVESLRGEGYVQ